MLEGPEGAGKSTQVARIAAQLRERDVPHLVLREPGGTRTGEEIRRILLDPDSVIEAEAECLLFLASRSQIVRQVLVPAMADGKIVVLDRFFLSTYAYQIGGRGLSHDQVRAANALATGGLVPALTLLLSIDPVAGMARTTRRGAPDRMELTGSDFHSRVSNAFRMFGTREWQRDHPECGEIVAIDAARTEDEVFEAIMKQLAARWPAEFVAGKPA